MLLAKLLIIFYKKFHNQLHSKCFYITELVLYVYHQSRQALALLLPVNTRQIKF